MFANISDLDKIVSIDKMGILDKWILKVAKEAFDEIEADFDRYDFVKGYSRLNNFMVSQLVEYILIYLKIDSIVIAKMTYIAHQVKVQWH